MSAMTDTPNLWHGVPFNVGDTVLMETFYRKVA